MLELSYNPHKSNMKSLDSVSWFIIWLNWMIMDFMIYIFAWLGFSILIAYAGRKKKIGELALFFISLLLSPLVGLLVMVLSNDKPIISKAWKEDFAAAEKAEAVGDKEEALKK